MILRSIESAWKRHPPLCHPDRSAAEWRDLQCAPRPSQIFRNKTLTLKQRCHPDRSAAKWRDLQSILRSIESAWKRHPPLCHPDRSGGICSAPLGPPKFSVTNPNPQAEMSSRTERSAMEASTLQPTFLGNVSRLTQRDAARVISRQSDVIDNFLKLGMMAKRIEPRILH